MKTLIGLTSAVNHTTYLAGEHGPLVNFTDLLLDGAREVRIDGGARSMIDNGDTIAVAGTQGMLCFRALAYKNLSRATKGNAGKLGHLIAGLIALCFATWGVTGYMSVFATIAGLWSLTYAARIAAAEHRLQRVAVKDWPPPA